MRGGWYTSMTLVQYLYGRTNGHTVTHCGTDYAVQHPGSSERPVHNSGHVRITCHIVLCCAVLCCAELCRRPSLCRLPSLHC